MGLTSALVQIMALRRLLTVFSGNELDIGITLAVWLSCVGVGSALGRRFSFRNSFAYSFIAVAVLTQAALFISVSIRPAFSLTPGEIIPLATTITATIISLAPVCLVIGSQFPLSVAYLKGDASTAYSLEAAGACIGGILFTFLLAGRVDESALAAVVGIANVLLAYAVLKKRWLIGTLAIPLILYAGAVRFAPGPMGRDQKPELRVESLYGEISVFRTRGQVDVYASGRFDFSYPDSQSEELRTHVPLSLHAAPSRVLLVGGSPALIRELLKYPALRVDFVQSDQRTADLSASILTDNDRTILLDERLRIIINDARQIIASPAARYDLIILNLPEPATAAVNRFYTVEFFRMAKAALRSDGILALSLPTSHGYIGRRMQAANGSVYQSLRAVFSNVALSSEEYGGMYASENSLSTDAAVCAARFLSRSVDTLQFHPLIFKDLFDPLKVDRVRARLEAAQVLNRDQRPTAYRYNLMLWADMSDARILNRILDLEDNLIFALYTALLLVSVAFFWKQKRTLYYSLVTTGYATMAFSVIILLAYQASFGSIYERIGLLSALFMAGSAAGAYVCRSMSGDLARLRIVEMSSLLLFLSAPLFFTNEPLNYALMFLCGSTGGAQFVIVNRALEGRQAGRFAGTLYAWDLGGSVLGVLLTALFFVPLFGIGNAILSLLALKTSSLVLLFSLGNRDRGC